MKKIMVLFAILFAMSSVATVFAEITRVQSGNGVEVEWKFKPEVSTYAGYNIDWRHFGMEGKAKLTFKNIIRAKDNEEFTRDDESQTLYSKIVIKDLEIKFEVEGAQGQKRSDDTLTQKTVKIKGVDGKEHEVLTKDTKLEEGKQSIRVKWGNINATVYLGPAYIQLKSKEHEKVNYVESLSDLDFVNIEEDVITPYSTAQYQASQLFAKDKDLKTSDDGTASAVKRTLDYKGSSINNEGMNKQLAALKIGFKLDKIVDVAVGVSTKYSFKESLALAGKFDKNKKPFNPFAVSLEAQLLAVENLTLKFKYANIFSKLNKDKKLEFLGEGNPLSLGLLGGYKLNIGDSFFVKPSLGFEVALENKAPYGTALSVTPAKSSDEKILTASYEAALGTTLGFQDSARYYVEKKEDDLMDLFDGDEEVLDGFGFAVLYGSTPYERVRKINIPYIGAKLTVWDSEDGDVVGLVPGLKHGLIFNFNYALGATQTVDDVEYKINPTADVGLSYEGSYTISFIKPKLGILFKAFNITNQETDSITPKGGKSVDFKRQTPNPFDLRLRLGVDIVNVVPNTTFEVMWESGDLIRTKDSSVTADGYHKTENFFRAKETGTGADSAESKAQYGYVYAGVKVKF